MSSSSSSSSSADWTSLLRDAKTERERALAVFAFRQQLVKDKTVDELRRALGVSSVDDVSLSGQCILK
jgi:hypothetical protein